MFETVGEKSRKDYALEVLRRHDVGDVVTYDELGEHLGTGDRQILQAAVRSAAREFLTSDRHAVEAVTNQGYRVVAPGEHMRLAEKQRRSSVKKLRRGKALVSHVDYSTLPTDARRLAEGMAIGFAHLIEEHHKTNARVSTLERAHDAVAERQDRTEEEVSELRARLARLEGKA